MKALATFAAAILLATMMVMMPWAASAATSDATENFVRTASAANHFEIVSSQLALQKSQDSKIRHFAQEMINDHTQIGEQMKAAVPKSTASADMISEKLDEKHQDIMDQLQSASGANFNKQYVDAQVDAHKDAVTLFTDYSKNGDDKVLRHLAGKTLPVLEKHLKHVQELQKTQP